MILFHRQVADALRYLRKIGLPFEQVKELHHLPANIGNYAGNIKYWSFDRKFEPQTFNFGMQVIKLANMQQQSGVFK